MHAGKFDATPVGPGTAVRPGRRARAGGRAAQAEAGRCCARAASRPCSAWSASAEAWRDLQDRLGVPVFEIPTLPPSVPGMRLFNAFKAGAGAGRRADPARHDGRTAAWSKGTGPTGVVVPSVVRDRPTGRTRSSWRPAASTVAASSRIMPAACARRSSGLPLNVPGESKRLVSIEFLGDGEHPIHYAGVRVNRQLQPVDAGGRVVLENVRDRRPAAGGLQPACRRLDRGRLAGDGLSCGRTVRLQTTGLTHRSDIDHILPRSWKTSNAPPTCASSATSAPARARWCR